MSCSEQSTQNKESLTSELTKTETVTENNQTDLKGSDDKLKDIENEDEDENSDDENELENRESDEDDEQDDEEEDDIPMTEEEFQREIAEAFANIRLLGKCDGQRLARSVRDSFCEINGREPELREVADVFSRIKSKLAEEAKEDGDVLTSSHNIIIKDDITNADVEQAETPGPKDDNKSSDTTQKTSLINVDLNNATKEEKEELLKFARGLVKEDLQIQAQNQLAKLIGREPTKQELNDMLVQLATTSLLDCNFDSADETSDYNPDAQEEKQQLLNDIEETTAFDQENEREKEEPTLINKPILTTPVKNKGNAARVDFYFEQYSDDCSQLLIDKAVNSFKKLHDRMPSNDELDNMKHFLHTEKADLLNEEALQSNAQEKTSFKLNFGAEEIMDVD